MTFVQWTFLFGAIAVLGPIVAHLLGKPRFRRVPFTMLRFLRRGQSQSHSRRRLRDLLILLLRCTIIVSIALLFAQPLLAVRAEPRQRRAVSWLALDDSISMAYRDGDETLFQRMTDVALDHIRRAPDDGVFGVYGLASGRSSQGLTRDQAAAQIKQLAPVPASVRLADFLSIIRQVRRTLSPDDTIAAVIMSDFTPRTMQEFGHVAEPAPVDQVHCEPIVPERLVTNTVIAGARLVGVSTNVVSIDVTLCHYGSGARQCTLTARTDGLRPVAVKDLTLVPGQDRVVRVQMDLESRLHQPERPCLPIELRLSPEDSLAEDDVFRLAAYVPSLTHKNLLVVHEAQETFLFETAVKALADSGSLERVSLTKALPDRLTAQDLGAADVVVFPSLPDDSAGRIDELKTVVHRGGKLIFFTTHAGATDGARLWQEGLVAALPERWVQEAAYAEPRPCPGVSLGLDERAARSLANYRLDKITLKGYWQCRPAPGAECIWRLTNGEPFLYGLSSGPGLSILVNTSIDDSLGLLAKSQAWVAFCRYLVGRADEARQFSFATGERPVLSLPDPVQAGQKPVAVRIEDCEGRQSRAWTQGNVLPMPTATGLGWMKTVDPPVLYAGINLPPGETDLSTPAVDMIAGAVQRAFVNDTQARRGSMQAGAPIRQRPIWQSLAWATIVLLLFEAALANRLKR